ncbi:uncharacterized protein LOC110836826 isoform X4 [Zootermopsis nevadensis]|uniref:uncharacterized protein LOC110836826 isoform X4 n=1 Tax=Zootermopsis nevadensis TaxID=136037 RepID=UPI000B8E8D67|nr:uncharacterized protein LOC110836826 isoform X4 [Zootermopsis nevadensis]
MMTVHLVASYFAGRAEPFIATRTSARQQYLNINRQDTSRHDTTRHDTTRRRGVETQYTCKSKTQLLTILHRCSNATLCEFQLMVTLHLIKATRSYNSRCVLPQKGMLIGGCYRNISVHAPSEDQTSRLSC